MNNKIYSTRQTLVYYIGCSKQIKHIKNAISKKLSGMFLRCRIHASWRKFRGCEGKPAEID